MPESGPILVMRDITKTFPGVVALDNVNLKVEAGEIHALVGENGAGKSTLMKVLSGVYPFGSYTGDIEFEGKPVRFRSITDSERLGIIIIHQELALVPLMSIAENIFLGNERARFGVIDWIEATIRARELLDKVGLREPPDTLVGDIGVGKQQLVELAKALAKKVKLLILDEPTSSLNETDSDALLRLLLEFKAQGITSILISHKLNEIARVADFITILRDGSTVETIDARDHEVDEDRIIRCMVGRELDHRYPQRQPQVGEIFFEVKDWCVHHPLHDDRQVIHDVNMYVRRGEIVGIAGLMGSGRTELAMSLFGRAYGRHITGSAFLDGHTVDLSSIRKAIDNGIAYVTEDRKMLGLILSEDVKKNITLANLGGVTKHGIINVDEEMLVATRYRDKLSIRTPSVHQATVNLSGGNQQKVVLSKWLFAQPSLLMLDEPTRGIDVGAKYEIYSIINELASEGKGILLISSELSEILGVCDRIYVMNDGRVVGEMPRQEASQERIMRDIMRTGRVTAA